LRFSSRRCLQWQRNHPDDETLGAGGYIAQATENGAVVRIVLVTDGDLNHQQAVRFDEFRTATGILGVPSTNLVFLNLPDGKLSSENQSLLGEALKTRIDQYHPDVIVFPHPRDYHPDHAAIGIAVEHVIDTEGLHVAAYEYLIHFKVFYPRPWKFDPHLYLLPPTSVSAINEQWLSFPLSQEIEGRKQKAVLTYKSQLKRLELSGLMRTFIRKNEMLASARN
jgi:N-acetylglucosamine malate deacetylase 1